MILTRRNSEVCDSLHADLVPDLGQIVTLVDLHFIGHDSCAEAFVKGVLQVPATLVLLNEATHGLFLGIGRVFLNSPDF